METLYIPEDVCLTSESGRGVLLYGVNGAGKSSFSKSIGIAVTMVQAGFYAPADRFVYSPYTRLYTRITCDDNLYRGDSSFMVELKELKGVVSQADCKSLVIGDEVCKGTEDISGLAIVGTVVMMLNKRNVSFVFASHLHKLPTLIDLTGIQLKHVEVKFEKDGSVNFTRKILDTQGPSLYGLEIAQRVLKNFEFENLATDLRAKLLGNNKLVKTKRSRYNKSLAIDRCHVCNSDKQLETHHIVHQKDCSKTSDAPLTEATKNGLNNLVVLCRTCHDKAHSNEFEIQGYRMTLDGKQLIIQ